MLILIPVVGDDISSARISSRADAQKWALLDFEEGSVKKAELHDTLDDLSGRWVDYVVLENSFENYMDFMEEGSMVLVRRAGQDSVDSIVEAFKFKELDEMGF